MEKEYCIQDLVNIDRLRTRFEDFSKATGFTTGFVSYPGHELLITTGWRDICTKFHRACPTSAICCKESNVYLTARLKDLKQLSIKPCGNGLVDAAIPVIIRGKHLASLATGQVLLAPPDIDFFKGLALKYGYDEDEYLAALAEVPVISEEQLKHTLTFLSGLAVQIAEEGLSKLRIQETANDFRRSKNEVEKQVDRRTAELQRANAQHHASQEQLRSLIEQAPVTGAMFDRNMNYIAASKRWVAIHGKGQTDLAGFNHYDLNYDIPDYWKEVHQNALAGTPQECEEDKWVKADGSVKWVRWAVHPWRTADQEIGGIVIVSEDITERKQSEESLRESEQRFRELIEQAPDAIVVMDLDLGRWVAANKSAEELFGCNREELLAGGPLRFYPADQPDGLPPEVSKRENDRRALAGERVVFQRAIRNAQGEDLFCEVRLVRQPSAGRRLLRASIVDITDRRRAELALQEAQAKLKTYAGNLEKTVATRTAKLRKRTAELQVANAAISKSEARLRALSDNIPNGYTYQMVHADDGRSWFEYISAGVERVYGITPEQVMADAHCLYAAVHPDDAHRLEMAGKEAARKLQIFDAEARIITPSGEIRWVHCRSTPFRLENGDTLSDGIATDITDQKIAETVLRESRAKLEAALASMPDAVFISDANGRFVNFNEAFATFCRFRNKGETLTTFTEYPKIIEMFMADGELAPVEMWPVMRALRGEVARDAEYRLRRKDTDETWIGSHNLAPIRDNGGAIVGSVVVARDITERKQAEMVLRESEERYHSLFENMMDGFAYCRMLIEPDQPPDFVYLKVNKAFETLTGLKNVVGKRVTEVIPGLLESNPDLFEIYGRVSLTGQPENFEKYFEPLDAWLSVAVYSPERGYFVSVFDNVTQRKRLEKEILEISEFERQRLGQDLHDDICQDLVGIALQTRVISNRLAATANPESEGVKGISRLVEQTAVNVRNLARTLFPSQLAGDGFVTALNDLAEHVERSFQIPCSFSCPDPLVVNSEKLASQLFRIAQEALHNAAKHSQGTQLSLRVDSDTTKITVTVADDGVGHCDRLSGKQGMGMRTMQYRANQIGADLIIQAKRRGGTKVVCSVPVSGS